MIKVIRLMYMEYKLDGLEWEYYIEIDVILKGRGYACLRLVDPTVYHRAKIWVILKLNNYSTQNKIDAMITLIRISTNNVIITSTQPPINPYNQFL